ncbi:MAG: hypothetical protein ACI8QC_000060 [Planctomycetota bacterium]|jgi:hypothetical protein
MNPKQLVRPLRRASLLLALVVGCYLVWRFGTVQFPAQGCSPLASVGAGDVLLVDRKPGELELGSALFVEVEGNLYLVRLTRRDEVGRLWVETEVAACPGADSEVFGWIERGAVRSRVMMALGL